MASSSSSGGANFEQFGRDIFSTISEQNGGKNVFLSSASIALALSMCALGARGNTLKQMLSTLKLPSENHLTGTAEQLMNIFQIAANDKQVQLRLANRLYGQKNYKLREAFVSQVRTSFKGDMQLEDFVHDGPRVVQTINAWVEEQTNRLIRNLLSPDDINADTRLVIVNCIYFKGVWQKQFNEVNTNENADFYETDQRVSKVPLMYIKEHFAYAEDKNLRVQVAHLPYKSQSRDVEFVFTIILPNKGVPLEQVERKLNADPDLMQELLHSQMARREELRLYLPRFRLETSFNLNDVLIKMGMIDAFNDQTADFTGIVSPDVDPAGLYVSKVIHKAFIEVNEQGTEAAAATAVSMRKKCKISVRTEPIEFKVNRPFQFFIRERQRDVTLFSGSEAAAATAVIMATKSLSLSRKPEPKEFKADRPFLFFIRDARMGHTLFSGKFFSPMPSH